MKQVMINEDQEKVDYLVGLFMKSTNSKCFSCQLSTDDKDGSEYVSREDPCLKCKDQCCLQEPEQDFPNCHQEKTLSPQSLEAQYESESNLEADNYTTIVKWICHILIKLKLSYNCSSTVFYLIITRVQITPETSTNITRYLYSRGSVRPVSCCWPIG